MAPYGFVTAVILSLSAFAQAAGAQVLEPPPRSTSGPPPDPNRTRQELTVQTDVLGGYDDNLAGPAGSAPYTTPVGTTPWNAPHQSGYVGFGETTGRYWLGRATRSIEIIGLGYVNTYGHIVVGPSYGGAQMVRARTTLGHSTDIEVDEGVQYSPFFSLGVFGPLATPAGPPTPDANPTNGLSESRSWTTAISGKLNHQWTRRMRTDAAYSFSNQTYENGLWFDSRSRTASLGFESSIGRNGDIRATYHRSDSQFAVPGGIVIPLNDQTADVGFGYHRRLSRTRQIAFTGGFGATFVETTQYATLVPFSYSAPSGFGTVRADVGRSWSVTADYRRAVSVLQGIVPTPFMAHAGTISAGGFTGHSVEVVLTAGYSNGEAGQPPGSIDFGQYDAYTGTSQFRFRLSRSLSSLVILDHFQYQLNALATSLTGVSPHMHRNSVRVGFTYYLPIFGSNRETPSSSPRGKISSAAGE